MALQVSHSPHVRDAATTQSLMRDVIIALLPATFAGWYFFGLRAVLITCLSVLSSIVFEYISRKIMKREQTISDLSAIVTGLLLALNLPPTLPLYMVVIGSFFAIVVVKQFFGGLGNNFINPALGARIFLVIAFPKAMTQWAVRSGAYFTRDALTGADMVSSATPLTLFRSSENLPSISDLFFGNRAGCIGEVCIAALLVGAIYLICRHVIRPVIPFFYLGTFILCVWFFGNTPIYTLFNQDFTTLSAWSNLLYEPCYMLFSGGLILGAFFMATDYVTSPITGKGKMLFGIGCGLFTFLIRYYGNISEGVSFAIIIMNILTPHIDTLTMRHPFGEVKAHEQK